MTSRCNTLPHSVKVIHTKSKNNVSRCHYFIYGDKNNLVLIFLKILTLMGEDKMNLEVVKTDSKNTDFVELIKLLDDDLGERYGELQKQYKKYNKVDYINDVVIIYKDEVPVACGGFKEHDIDTIELKRIFVMKDHRGQGLSKLIINKLEELARNKEYKYALLETGIKQKEAINLYKSNGYYVIQNYEPYVGNANSICMKKILLRY